MTEICTKLNISYRSFRTRLQNTVRRLQGPSLFQLRRDMSVITGWSRGGLGRPTTVLPKNDFFLARFHQPVRVQRQLYTNSGLAVTFVTLVTLIQFLID